MQFSEALLSAHHQWEIEGSADIQHVVNQLEKKSDQFTPLWKWRTVPQGHQANGLEEGEMSGRNLARVELGTEDDLKWERKAAASAVEAAARAKL